MCVCVFVICFFPCLFRVLDQAFGSWDSTGGRNPHPFDPVAIDRTREINGVGYDAVRRISPGRMIFLSPNAMASIATASYVYPDSDLGGQWLKHGEEFDKMGFIANVKGIAMASYIKKATIALGFIVNCI